MFLHARRILATSLVACVILALALPALAQTKPAAPKPAPRAVAPAAKPATAVAKPATPVSRPATTAGGTGRISGKVLERGSPLGYANVIVLGTKQGAASDENGNFVIVGVPVGTYQVKLMATGYDPVIQSVQVNAGQVSTVTFSVGVAKVVSTQEEFEVRAEKRIDTKSSTTKQSIQAEKLREIPVDNLSETFVVESAPFVTVFPYGSWIATCG